MCVSSRRTHNRTLHSLQSSDFALQRKSHLCIPRKGIARPQSQFPHSCVCERFLQYIPKIGPHIFLQQNRKTAIVGIYNSLTDTWIWKLGLRPPYNSFTEKIYFEFSGLCLCSVWYEVIKPKSKLAHLPPLKILCVWECWIWTRASCKVCMYRAKLR